MATLVQFTPVLWWPFPSLDAQLDVQHKKTVFIFCNCVLSKFPESTWRRWHGDVRPAKPFRCFIYAQHNFVGISQCRWGCFALYAAHGTRTVAPPTSSASRACVNSTGSNIIYPLWPLDQLLCHVHSERAPRSSIWRAWRGASRYGRPRSHFPRILFRFHSASLPFSQPVLFVFVFLIFLVCFHAELGNWTPCRRQHIVY